MSLIDPLLKSILVCPVSHGPLEEDEAHGYLICRESGLAYPVRDGIPIMLVDEAIPLSQVGAAAAPAPETPTSAA